MQKTDLITVEEENPAPPGAGLALPDSVRFALEAAGAGLRVLPVRPGSKKPRIKNCYERATCDPATILHWAAEFPGCNFGAVPARQVLVLDVDNSEAEDALLALQVELRADFEAGACIVKSGGDHSMQYALARHIYLGLPDDMEPREVEALLSALAARGIEANPAQVVLPGSTVRCEYVLTAGSFKHLPPLPEALRVLARQQLAQEAQAVSGVSGVPIKREGSRRGLDRPEWKAVPEGGDAGRKGRDDVLIQVAGHLAGEVRFGRLSKLEAEQQLLEHNRRELLPPLPDRVVLPKLTYCLRRELAKGQASPRGEEQKPVSETRLDRAVVEALGSGLLSELEVWLGVLTARSWQRGEGELTPEQLTAQVPGAGIGQVKGALDNLHLAGLWESLQAWPVRAYVSIPEALLLDSTVRGRGAKLLYLVIGLWPEGSEIAQVALALARGLSDKSRTRVTQEVAELKRAGWLHKGGVAWSKKIGRRERCNSYYLRKAAPQASTVERAGEGGARRIVSSYQGGLTGNPSLEATSQAVEVENPYMGSRFRNLDRTLEAVEGSSNSKQERLARADKLLELKPLLAGEARQVLLEAVEFHLRGDDVSFARAVELLLAIVEVHFSEVLTLVEEACGAAA